MTMVQRSMRPALAWALLIALLCLTPGKALPQWQWADLLRVDKLVHTMMFGVLTVLLARGLRGRPSNELPLPKVLLMAGVVSVLYGASMEALQEIPGLNRRGDLIDLIANTAGAVAGAIWLRWRLKRKAAAISAAAG